MIIDISLHVLLQAAHTFCVSVLRVHVVLCVHVLSMCVPARLFTSDLAYIYIYHAHYRLVSRFTGVHFSMVCMNVHQCTQHTVAHCILI